LVGLIGATIEKIMVWRIDCSAATFFEKTENEKKFTGKGEAKNQKKTRKKRCQCIKVGVIFFCVCVIVFASSRRRTRAVGPLLKAKIVFFVALGGRETRDRTHTAKRLEKKTILVLWLGAYHFVKKKASL